MIWHNNKNNYTTLHPFNGLFSRTTWVSRYQKGKTSQDSNKARDDGVLGCSGISWTIYKQFEVRSRQTTTRTPHHLIFTGWMLFLKPNQQCQSTEGTTTRTRKIIMSQGYTSCLNKTVDQGCSPKKEVGGTPETRLRQRFFKQFRPTYTYTLTRQKNCHSGSLVVSCDTATRV